MRKNYYILLCLIFSTISYSHDSNISYFEIKKDKDNLCGGNKYVIKAIFPWTLRDALMSYNSHLNSNSSLDDFKSTLISYVKRNFYLQDIFGNYFSLLDINDLPDKEQDIHNHGFSFLLKYCGIGEVHKVFNTLLFDISTEQLNINFFFIGGKKIQFKTDINNMYYIVN